MNQSVEDFNNQLEKTIRLLQMEEMMLQRKRNTLQKSNVEESIIDEIKRRN